MEPLAGVGQIDSSPNINIETVEDLIQTPLSVLESSYEEMMLDVDKFEELAMRDQALIGYECKTFKILEKHLDGIQKMLYLWGGISQSAKTMNMVNLGFEMLEANENIIVVYFSIDDSRHKVYTRLMARISTISINDCQLLKRYVDRLVKSGVVNEDQTEPIYKRIKEYQQYAREIMKRFIVFDSKNTVYVEDMFDYIKILQEQESKRNKEIVVLIDNFHLLNFRNKKLATLPTTARLTEMSHLVKKMQTFFDISLHCTTEIRKLNHVGAPELDDLKDAVALHYDADVIFLLHNDDKSKSHSTELKWTEDNGYIVLMRDKIKELSSAPYLLRDEAFIKEIEKISTYPIIQLNVAKNKAGSFQGPIYYALKNTIATLYELNEDMQSVCRDIPIERFTEAQLRESKISKGK